MAYDQLDPTFPTSAAQLQGQIDQLLTGKAQRFRRLWMYYRNPMLSRCVERDEQGADRPYRQAQEWGLPSRVTGVRSGSDISISTSVGDVARKEVVIENDIAWRIDTMVDFLFGKSITIASLATDPDRRRHIEFVLATVLQHNGGIALLQQLATLGAVYGFVDLLVKFNPSEEPSQSLRDDTASSLTNPTGAQGAESVRTSSTELAAGLDASPNPGSADTTPIDARLTRIARSIRWEIVEPARVLPFLSQEDWRDVRAYAQVYLVPRESAEPRSAAKPKWMTRLLQLATVRRSVDSSSVSRIEDHFKTIIELLTPTHWQRFEDEKLIAEGENSLGEIPLVHIQNITAPFDYSGVSDVESLIPLQDELNTRLCDRAHRITMQSFKMYLGKGIDGFNDLPVAPGRMWMTENDAADVIEFGGDPDSPSEDRHITELREAMDKVSGVTPIAAGAIRDRIGNLTSAAALRVTLMALLAKTERKRSTYGQAISRLCELSLAWLDRAGLFHTTPEERRVEIRWPNLLPDSEMERLNQARAKLALGVSKDTLLRELGYAPPMTSH